MSFDPSIFVAIVGGKSKIVAAFSVDNLAFDYGVLSNALAGAKTISPVTGTITSITIDSGNTGTVYDTTGDQIRLAATKTATTLTLGCTATFSDSSTDTFTATITAIANEYAVRTDTEFNTVEAVIVGGQSVQFREIGTYAAGLLLKPTVAITGLITLRGESITSKTTIKNILVSEITATGSVTIKHFNFNDPLDSGRNGAVIYDRPGDIFRIEECTGTGPFTPSTNVERTYQAKIRVINATGTPTIGESIAEGGGGANEIFDFEEISAGSFDIFFDDQAVGNAAAWGVGDTLTETTTGETFEVSVVRSGGLPATQQAAAIISGGGLSDWNQIIVSDCVFNNFSEGIKLLANDVIDIRRVDQTDGYRDAYKFSAKDVTSPPTCNVENTTILNIHSKFTDFNNPHPDMWQWSATAGFTVDWAGILIQNNIGIIGDTRSIGIQGIFLDDLPAGKFYIADIRNNIIVTVETVHGVTIRQAKNCTIHNMTAVHADPDNAVSNVISLGNVVSDGGGNVAENNVADNTNLTGFTKINNVALGLGGATIPYATAFDPATFVGRNTSIAEVLARYEPEESGPLLDGVTYVVGDTGCIDNTPKLFEWDPASVTTYTQNFYDTVGTAHFTATTLGASDSAFLTFTITVNTFDSATLSGTKNFYAVSGRSSIVIVNGKLKVVIRDTSGTVIYDATAVAAFLTATFYHIHIDASMTGTPTVDINVNGATWDMGTPATSPTTGTIDHTRSSYGLLASTGGTDIPDMEFSDYYMDHSQSISVGSFYSGAPLDISSVGSPEIFFGNTQLATNLNSGTNLGSATVTVGSATFVDV
ncbi:MAG: hypothetical protein JKY96_03415 [Phycisphaerales bacterium]|nr:hypothetical protein [Phycisphaerales bacterium]